MSQNDVFALRNSSFNAFLFAEVGTEQNGSPLTILSTLARLGKDPWAQAAEWAGMPNAATTECLTQSIMQMPLCGRALVEANVTAGRLVMLLPRQSGTTGQTASQTIADLKLPPWLPLAVFCAVMGLMVMAGTFVAEPATRAPVAQSVQSGQ
jgi:hypothetical protein